MASSDYDRPVPSRPVDSTAPPYATTSRGPLRSPLGMALAIVFVVLLLMALLG
jgi:hypothetical protein